MGHIYLSCSKKQCPYYCTLQSFHVAFLANNYYCIVFFDTVVINNEENICVKQYKRNEDATGEYYIYFKDKALFKMNNIIGPGSDHNSNINVEDLINPSNIPVTPPMS